MQIHAFTELGNDAHQDGARLIAQCFLIDFAWGRQGLVWLLLSGHSCVADRMWQ
jgi:hypothetical protein